MYETEWSTVLQGIKLSIGLRMSETDERLGSDYVEHGISREGSTGCADYAVQPHAFGLRGGLRNTSSIAVRALTSLVRCCGMNTVNVSGRLSQWVR